MAGSFGSLSTALSALRYNRVAMDVASGNVANVGTEGYTRRRVVGETVGAPAVPAIWSRYDSAGDGVTVGRLDRMVDPFLDSRARNQHGQQALYDVRSSVLARVEAGLGEPGDNGVAAALTDYWQGWHDVANNPGDGAARSQIIGRANTLVSSMAGQASNIATEWSDQRAKLDALTVEVNTLAADVAELNKSIKVAAVSGTDAGTLLDNRDQLTLRLAELTGAATSAQPDGSVEVRIGGVALVTDTLVTPVRVVGADDMSGVGADPLRLGVGGTAVTPGGEMGGMTSLLNTTLPDYVANLDAVALEVASAVNAQHQAGFDRDGNAGVAFFSGTTAATLQVAIADPDLVAASGEAGTLDESNADALAGLRAGDESYRRLINNFGTEVASARRVASNQQVLTDQIDGARESLSGVNLDEEMVNMLAHQRAYEAASRVMTTLDSVLDTLINRTGLVR